MKRSVRWTKYPYQYQPQNPNHSVPVRVNQGQRVRVSVNIEYSTSLSRSTKLIKYSFPVILIDEYEDVEEEDLNCEEEFDQYQQSWDMDSDAIVDADADGDETTEDTALLHRPTRTAIVITPISPVSYVDHSYPTHSYI